jgi:hypothetical protein
MVRKKFCLSVGHRGAQAAESFSLLFSESSAQRSISLIERKPITLQPAGR